MKTDRIMFDNLWQQIANYAIPRKGNILTKNTPGQLQTLNIYDTTANDAGGIFASGCVTHICPAGDKWIRLEAKGKEASPAVKQWYDRCTDKLTDIIYDSNFYEAIHEDFNDAGHFCTSMLLVDEDKEQLVNYVAIPVGTFAIQENCRGQVDTVGREWQWSARQAEQKWGRSKLGKQQTDALTSNEPTAQDRLFTYVHFVEPRTDNGYEGGPAAPMLRPWRSIYICEEDQQVIEEGGYYTWPYPTSRLLRSNNEVYGRGPGTDKLPDIKMVNAMMRDYLIAVEKGVKPGWLMGDEQSADPDNRPNGITYWDTSNIAGKPEVIITKADLQAAEMMIEKVQRKIEKGYYVDLFQMLMTLQEQKREKTAYEVQQMVAEQLTLFSPLFGRMTREKLNPTIERTFDIACRASAADWARGQDGIMPLPPQEIRQNAGYNIVYVSKIALAIKSAENQSFATMMTLVEQAAALDPSVVDVIDVQGAVRRTARNVGFPALLIRTERDVAKRGAARQQAQAAATGPQQAEAATAAVKNLGPEMQTQAARKIMAGAGAPA